MQTRARPAYGKPVLHRAGGLWLFLLQAALLLNTGCLVRRIHIERKNTQPAARLLTVSLEELVQRLKTWDQQVSTINATVDLEPSLGTVNKEIGRAHV